MSRDSILDDAIAKAEADGNVQLVEWLRATRGAGRAMRRYSAKLKELEDFARRLEECAKRREPVTLFGVNYVAEDTVTEAINEEVRRLDAENRELRKLLRAMWVRVKAEYPRGGFPDMGIFADELAYLGIDGASWKLR